MSGAQRRKGRDGENEARAIFARAGFTVTPIQAGRVGRSDTGDFTVTGFGLPNSLIGDAKRREKVRVVEWSRGIESAARDGEVPFTMWRQSHEPWRVTLLAEDFVRLVAR